MNVSPEVALTRHLQLEWETLNTLHFRGQLRRVRMELVDGEHHLGEWSRQYRVIRLSRPFLLREGWGAVMEVLKHEMAHQYAHEVLGAIDEPPHGPAFRAACERIGIDANASGLPVVNEDESRVLRRVTKLLALAESPNAHEAAAAAAAAQRLMLQYNIGAPPAAHSFRQLGRSSARLPESERWLANILGEHFFVSALWVPSFDVARGRAGKILEICGTAPNLELAAYVYEFLKRTSEKLWKQHSAVGQVWGSDRARFLSGVMRGFFEKLQESAVTCREEGLVWVGDPALDAWFQRRHPRVVRRRYGGNLQTPAYEAGREQGREIVLHKPIAGTTGGSGRLLG